jgi:hypothetical protein
MGNVAGREASSSVERSDEQVEARDLALNSCTSKLGTAPKIRLSLERGERDKIYSTLD